MLPRMMEGLSILVGQRMQSALGWVYTFPMSSSGVVSNSRAHFALHAAMVPDAASRVIEASATRANNSGNISRALPHKLPFMSTMDPRENEYDELPIDIRPFPLTKLPHCRILMGPL